MAAGMPVRHCCVLAVTILLLVCEVAVSQLCKSLITLVDGFHTLFMFMCVALPPPPPPPPQTARVIQGLRCSAPVPPRDSSSSVGPPSTFVGEPPREASTPVNSRRVSSSELPPPAAACGVSHAGSRVQPVGAFLSALLLASLCVSYLLQIISFSLDPHPARRPLTLVLVGAVSLLHKTLLLRLKWDQLRVREHKQPEAEAHMEVNHTAASDGEIDSHTSSVCKSPHGTEAPEPRRRRAACLLPFVVITQGLLTSLLALSFSLVMLLMSPHGAGTCRLLVYLDPALALLAVVVLIATVRPQMCRYGLMLLQATPPHVSVSELERRIASVPDVQAVHDLHIWQLAESVTVASAHVHCSAALPAHRCAELMSGVTKVLQSVGVSCCTVQPEFTSCCVSSGDRECDAALVAHGQGPCLPPALACSLACGKACARSVCCSPHEEKASSLVAAADGASKEEPQSLVIENTFL